MNVFSLTFRKLKAFRMTIPSLVLFVLASYRCLTSGESIQLVGICAAVVPFICQFKNFSTDPDAPALTDVVSSYLMNWVLMLAYLGWVLLLTWIGKTFIPGYVVNPYFTDMALIALCGDAVFISAVIPICRELAPMQRMIPGLILTNALLIFMMMASGYVKAVQPTNIPVIAGGFIGLIVFLTFSMILAGYVQRKQK